jgi:signal transduction histidine kinase
VREALDTDSVVDLAVGDVSGRVPFSHYLVVALSELVDNAVEHGDAGAVGVEVTGAAEAPEADVRLAVSDDGPGLPREQWQILHGDREITQLQHGNGLGLWLVKWVTDRHNGRLRLDQADDDGTTVSILLPTVEA